MRSGGMRHTIEIWASTKSSNEYGEHVESWSKVKSTKAQVTKQSGSTNLNNSEVFNMMTIKVEVWNHHGLTEINRIKWKGNLYSIDFIEPSYDERKQVLQCNRINQ